MGACVTLFVPAETFKPLKLVLKFHIWIPHEKIADQYFFLFRVTFLFVVKAL